MSTRVPDETRGGGILGEVPDIRPHISGATVVCAIRIGGGTRLKVVEALAMGKPMVSTAVGCEGVAVRDGEHLMIADDALSFASKIARYLKTRPFEPPLGKPVAASLRRGTHGSLPPSAWRRSTEKPSATSGTRPTEPEILVAD